MRLRNYAAKLFDCTTSYIDDFSEEDPLNPCNKVSGFINRKKSLTGGSLLITNINGVDLNEPQVIYGTPKLRYPYEEGKDNRDYIKFPEHDRALLYEKFDGVNIMFYRYFDAEGKMFIAAKTKGTAFVKDGDFGDFLTLTKKVLDRENFLRKDITSHLTEGFQSVACELYGYEEPHLVKYSEDINLIPLFITMTDGRILPFFPGKDITEGVVDVCKYQQFLDLSSNVRYRQQARLLPKYEYEHFATEGKVLYLLDAGGLVINRTLYKIKPVDVEEVHWASFENNYQRKVEDAMKKIKRDGGVVNKDSMQEELDMGPKEWDAFGRQIMKYIGNKSATSKVVILCGLPGSGKSTLAKKLEETGFVRVNQDDLGSRNKCKGLMVDSLKQGRNIVIDRCNFDVNQRKTWIDLAKLYGVEEIVCTYIDKSEETCYEQAKDRKDHPTIDNSIMLKNIIAKMNVDFVAPSTEEGFTKLEVIDERSDQG